MLGCGVQKRRLIDSDGLDVGTQPVGSSMIGMPRAMVRLMIVHQATPHCWATRHRVVLSDLVKGHRFCAREFPQTHKQ